VPWLGSHGYGTLETTFNSDSAA